MILYLFYVVLCIFVLFIVDFIKIDKKNYYIIMTIMVFLNSLLVAILSLEMPDSKVYMYWYDQSIDVIENMHIINLKDIFFNRNNGSIELSFVFYMYLYKKLGFNFAIFKGTTSLIVSFLVLCGLKKIYRVLHKNNNIKIDNLFKLMIKTWIYYLFLQGVLYTSVAIRSGLTIGFGLCFLGIMLDEDKKKYLAFLCIIIAVLIHSTGVVWIAIYLILVFFPYIKNKYIYLFTWLSLLAGYFLNFAKYTIVGIIFLLHELFSILGINAFSSYLNNLEYSHQKKELMIILIIGCLCMMTYKCNKYMCRMLSVVLIGLAVFTFAYPINAVSRIVDYFIIMIVPLAGLMKISDSKTKYLMVKILMICLAVPQFLIIWRS